MNKNRIARPTRCDELAQHSEVEGTSRGGKCGGRAGKQRVLTWGDPTGAIWRGVSKGHSSEEVRESGWSEGPNRTGTFRCYSAKSPSLRSTSRVEDTAADDARRPGSGKCRHDGKHGNVQEPLRCGWFLTTASRPASVRNRRMRSRMYGGVAAGTGPHGSVPASRFDW